MKFKPRALLLCLLIPLAIGAAAGFLTQGSMETYLQLDLPPLSPPGWVFPVVWTVLYVMMGVGSYLVLTSSAPRKQIAPALRLYAVQLAVNFFWSILFFSLGRYCLAFLWLILLWVLILLTLKRWRAVSPAAAALLLPYLLWVTFAGYLNLSICLRN